MKEILKLDHIQKYYGCLLYTSDLKLDTIGIHKDYEEMENRVVFGGLQALSWLVFPVSYTHLCCIRSALSFDPKL